MTHTDRSPRSAIEIRSFEPRIEEDEAIARTARLTGWTYLHSKVRALLGRSADPVRTVRLYYPDYIAYTTVELRRLAGNDRTIKFLAAVDAITGRVGEVDLELPDRETVAVPERHVLDPQLHEEAATEEWRDWLFPYLDRAYRPVKRPETSLDRLELVYTPFWIVDYGADGDRYAVSTLTEQVELLGDIGALDDHYGSID